MGITIWIFIVNNDDWIQRFPLTKYERLIVRDPNERLLEYANKRVQYIMIGVDLVNREPVEILRAQFSYLSFDSDGLIDRAKLREEVKLYIDIWPPAPIIRYPWDIVDPKPSLPKERHNENDKWTPTPEIEAALLKAIFR
jgi:hypothetical protein